MKPGKNKQRKPERILPNPRGAEHPPLLALRFNQPNFGVPEDLAVRHLAREERALINKSIVDLSTASEFFKKHVEIVSELRDHAAHVGGYKYKLSDEVLRGILISRYCGAESNGPNPADRLARALYWSAKSVAFRRAFVTGRNLDKTWAWQDYLGALKGDKSADLRAKGQVRVPVRPDGTLLEPWSRPDLSQLTIHFVFNTELSQVHVNGLPPGVVDVKNTVVPDGMTEDINSGDPVNIERLPELTIRVEGAPVAKMMVSSLLETKAAQEFTRRLLAGVSNELNRFLGLAARRGRPSLAVRTSQTICSDARPTRPPA